jgi:pre-mRNA-splicing factor SYF1
VRSCICISSSFNNTLLHTEGSSTLGKLSTEGKICGWRVFTVHFWGALGSSIKMSSTGAEIQELLADDRDLEFEAELARNPYRLKNWWRYLAAKTAASRHSRNVLHERALKYLPNSYKLWHQYLSERRNAVEGKCVTDPACQIVINTYERALVHLHKMPTIWAELLQLLMQLKKGTQTRKAFDRALQSLPITQHDRIWPLYLKWAKSIGVKETAIRVYRRYLMYDPQHREQYVDYLEAIGEWQEAANQLAICVNDESFISPEGHTRHQVSYCLSLLHATCHLC